MGIFKPISTRQEKQVFCNGSGSRILQSPAVCACPTPRGQLWRLVSAPKQTEFRLVPESAVIHYVMKKGRKRIKLLFLIRI
jgi:hypothetical protein